MSIIAIPIQLLTSALIGRVSPAAAGTLGVVELFYNAIITFFLFGGETAIIKLLSDIDSEEEKKSFITYYIGLCIIFFAFIVTVFRLLQIDLIKIIIGNQNNTTILMYVIGAIIVIHNIILAYQKERNEFLLYSIGYRLFNFIALFSTIILFLKRDLNFEFTFYFFIGIGFSIYGLRIIKGFKFNTEFLKKAYFKTLQIGGFVFFLHVSTIVAFFFDKMDQILILNIMGISTLGGYYLIIKLANVVKLIPNIYNSTFYPFLCKELVQINSNDIFKIILNKNLLILFPTTMFIMFNSRMLINILFGSEYLAYANVLQILMFVSLMGSPGMILNNYLFALGKSKQYFILSTITVFAQLLAMYPLLNILGIVGLVYSRGIALILTIIFCSIYLKKIGFKITLPKYYFGYVLLLYSSYILVNHFGNNYLNLVISTGLLSLFVYKHKVEYAEMLFK